MSVSPIGGVYRITVNRPGDRPMFYIGQAKDLKRRWIYHLSALRCKRHRNTHLQHAYAKYGESALSCQTILVCSPHNFCMYEQAILDSYPQDQVYNIHKTCVSTRLGVPQSESTRARIGVSNLGKKRTEETKARIGAAQAWKRTGDGRARMSVAQTGKKLSDETRRRISVAHTGRKMSPESIAKGQATRRAQAAIYGKPMNAMKGKKVSAEALANRAEARAKNAAIRGYSRSEQAIQNIAAANKRRAGILHTPEHRAKIGEASRRVWATKRAERHQGAMA